MADGPTILQRLRLRVAGRRAWRLAETADGVRVIARFERSAYVADARGRVACVGADGLGFGPLNALVARDEFDRAALAIGDPVAFDMSAATAWQPHHVMAPIGDARPRAAATLRTALSRTTPRGLADGETPDAVSIRARRALAALRDWSAAQSGDVPAEIASLIGLGPGLTPAGDDALGGAMIALRIFGHDDSAARLASAVLPLARTQTSAISRAHLEAAADGEGADALHDTLAAIVSADAGAAVAALHGLDRLGHSSGWDALAGVMVVLSGLT